MLTGRFCLLAIMGGERQTGVLPSKSLEHPKVNTNSQKCAKSS
jgi:hypothetical protein